MNQESNAYDFGTCIFCGWPVVDNDSKLCIAIIHSSCRPSIHILAHQECLDDAGIEDVESNYLKSREEEGIDNV